MQSKVYTYLKSKTVRDLYWLLFTDAPLSDNYDLKPYSLFPEEILDKWKVESLDYFLQLDENSADIDNFVNRRKNKRLGFYAEALLSYFFQTFKETELLLQNFQINKEQITIGEIDFIILYNGKVIHLECAVKYYLLKDSNLFNNPSQWVGPRLKDNLELKINKIIQHQIPLGGRKEITAKINRSIDVSYLFLKGVFFAEEPISLELINRNTPHSFIRVSNLKELKVKAIDTLSRPNWLSSLSPIQSLKTTDSIEIDMNLVNPILYMFNDGKARFVVADDWGKE